MYNDLFSIGSITVHSYGAFIAIGIIAAYVVMMKRTKKRNINIDTIDNLFFFVLLSGFLGSRILYCITEINQVMKDPSIIFNLSDGYVVYGGIIGGVLGGYVYCKRKKMPFLQILDLAIPSLALAQGFGRIGCFMAGCCYGMETTSGIGVVFPVDSLAPSGTALIPTQLISSVFDFVLFFVLIMYDKRKKEDGQVAALYLILYSVGRFIIELFRGDLIRGNVGALSTSQFISVFIFLIGIGFFITLTKKKMKKDN
ncbi:MAG: prolipoprotein diacylglyceryl transferase [Longicatena sp.]